MPMTCPKCGTANADGSTFCIGCGTDLAVNPASAAAPPPGTAGSAGGPGASSPWPEQPQGSQGSQGSNPPQPGYGQPGTPPPPPPPYGQPQYGQPQYGQPQYGQPQYGQYGQPGYGQYYGAPPVKNNMAMSVVSLVLGALSCLVFGIPGLVAVIFSSQVGTKLAMGDIAGAEHSARTAKTWAIVGFVLVGISALAIAIIIIVAAANSSTNSGSF